MSRIQDMDTRYFVEVDLDSLKIIRCSFDQKQNLNKGRQNADINYIRISGFR